MKTAKQQFKEFEKNIIKPFSKRQIQENISLTIMPVEIERLRIEICKKNKRIKYLEEKLKKKKIKIYKKIIKNPYSDLF